MKKKEQYHMGEAIKNFYETEPLKNDLASAVVNRVFAKEAKPSKVFENWAYFILFLLIVASIGYYFNLLVKLSLLPILMLLIVTGTVAWLSFKEYTILSKRLLG